MCACEFCKCGCDWMDLRVCVIGREREREADCDKLKSKSFATIGLRFVTPNGEGITSLNPRTNPSDLKTQFKSFILLKYLNIQDTFIALQSNWPIEKYEEEDYYIHVSHGDCDLN